MKVFEKQQKAKLARKKQLEQEKSYQSLASLQSLRSYAQEPLLCAEKILQTMDTTYHQTCTYQNQNHSKQM